MSVVADADVESPAVAVAVGVGAGGSAAVGAAVVVVVVGVVVELEAAAAAVGNISHPDGVLPSIPAALGELWGDWAREAKSSNLAATSTSVAGGASFMMVSHTDATTAPHSLHTKSRDCPAILTRIILG